MEIWSTGFFFKLKSFRHWFWCKVNFPMIEPRFTLPPLNILLKALSSWYFLLQSYQSKYQDNVWNLFKANNKPKLSKLTELSKLWSNKCRLGIRLHFFFLFIHAFRNALIYSILKHLKSDSYLPKKIFDLYYLLNWRPFKNDKKYFLFDLGLGVPSHM